MIAINDLLSMSGGKGERLYFFYARTRPDRPCRQPRRKCARRLRLQRGQHRQLDCAQVAVGVLRDDPVPRPVLLRRRLPQHPVGEPRVRDRALDASARARSGARSGPAVHPLRDVTGADSGRVGGVRQGARSLHRRAPRRPRRHGFREGVVVGALVLRGALGTARRLRQEEAREREASSGGATGAPLIQVPQDAGSRGVAGRDRDPVVASFPARALRQGRARGRARARRGVRDRTGTRPQRHRRHRRGRRGEDRRPPRAVPARAEDVRPASRRGGLRGGADRPAGRLVRERQAKHLAAESRRRLPRHDDRRAGSYLDAGRAGVSSEPSRSRHRA